MTSSPQIIVTEDGSHTLYNPELNETYHSRHGARQESVHVFIKNGLLFYVDTLDPKIPVNILEVGFGTGLNALLALQFARERKRPINYTTLEPFPVVPEIWSQLNFLSPDDVDQKVFETLHESVWGEAIAPAPFFTFTKHRTTLQSAELKVNHFDLIFYDAFAPSKQPEMWTLDALTKSIHVLKTNGIWVTYCARGQMKRDLKSLGCIVESLPGPPGKVEMTRAKKP